MVWTMGGVAKFCIKTVLVLLLITVTWIPVFILRFCVSILGPILVSRLYSIVEKNNAMFANIAHDSANMAILLTTTLSPGPSITLTELRKKFEVLLKYRDEVSGELVYSKLKQSVDIWGGFPFWVNANFNLDYHIIQTNLKEGQDLIELKKELLSQEFERRRSPWQVILIKGVTIIDSKGQQELRDVILFKFHHCLLDGHGLTNLLVGQVCDKKADIGWNDKVTNSKLPSPPKRFTSIVKDIVLDIAFHFGALIDFIQVIDWIPEENGLHSHSGQQLAGNMDPHLLEITSLSVEDVKKARKRGGVHYFVVVLEAVTSAIRETFLRIGAQLPSSISCYSPLPHPSHPGTLGNYWWGLTIPLPVGVAEKKERLGILTKFLTKEATPWRAGCTLKLQELLGGLSSVQLGALTDVNHFTTSASDFAGPTEELVAFGGRRLLGIDYVVGFPKGRLGIVWHGLSYNGSWHMNLMVDRTIFGNKNDVDAIASDFAKAIVTSSI